MKLFCVVLLVACAYAQAAEINSAEGIYEPIQLKIPAQQLHTTVISDQNAADDELLASELQLLDTPQKNLVANQIKNFLEGFRDVIVNGNDNLPPLDPFYAEKIGPFVYSTNGIRISGNIKNLHSDGLRWYVVDEVTFNALRLSFRVHITLPWLRVNARNNMASHYPSRCPQRATNCGAEGTEPQLACPCSQRRVDICFVSDLAWFCGYDAQARILLLNHKAGGNFRVFVYRVEVGVDIRVGTNLLAGHLILRELEIKIDIHDTLIQIDGMTGSATLNNLISGLVQNISQDLIQSELQNVSQMLSEELFDTINDVLKDYTLADILG